MNDRIRELAEQAGLKYHNWITNESNVKDGDFKYPRFEDYEKFAELIVRECITRIEGCATTPEDDEFVKGYNKGVSKVASQVKHHFGVE